MEWPPRSGKMADFPEIDNAAFFRVEQAREKIHAAEAEFLVRLQDALSGKGERQEGKANR